ncbi:unnamed protein product [Ixodes hexagonus]
MSWDTESPEPVVRDDFTEDELSIPAVKYESCPKVADLELPVATVAELASVIQQMADTAVGDVSRHSGHTVARLLCTAEDMVGLLFHFLDELLFVFSAEPYFIGRKVKILEFDKEAFRIKARVYGEVFDLGKHPQGSEVKAITYSNMQVWDNPNQHEVFVIIDI